MKAILLFSYAEFGKHIHNFLSDETQDLKSQFEEIHIICRETPLVFDKNIFNDRVKVHMFTKKSIKRHIALFPFRLLHPVVKRDLQNARTNNSLKLGYLLRSAKVWSYSQSMLEIIDSIIDTSDGSNWFAESFWLDGGALAIARAKKTYPNLKTIARAHSVEIDPVKNEYCCFEYKEFINESIDKIVFISLSGKKFYEDKIKAKFRNNVQANLHYTRLGSNKLYEGTNVEKNNGVFHILSCSRVEPVKRVGMIAKALLSDYIMDIEWTHIGTGTEFEELSLVVKQINKYTHNKAILKGDFSQEDVQRYLANEPVDLFVNVSSSEGVPVSIMEAQSYGIPTLATNVGGTCEIVDDTCGFLADENINEKTLVLKLSEIMNVFVTDKVAYERKRKNSYKNWSDRYDRCKCYKEFIDLALN